MDSPPQEYRWAADDFERAAEAGILGQDRRLELLHGRIIDRMAESPLHACLATLLIELLRTRMPPDFLVRGEKPIRIDFDGEPVPDISVLSERLPVFRRRHPVPAEVALLIEIAITSAEYDLGQKALLYAQAGITDYWVILPEAGEIAVHREPTPDGYAVVARVGEEGNVAPLAAPASRLPVRELLGRSSNEPELPERNGR